MICELIKWSVVALTEELPCHKDNLTVYRDLPWNCLCAERGTWSGLVWYVCSATLAWFVRAVERRKDTMFELNCMEIDRNSVGGLLIRESQAADG